MKNNVEDWNNFTSEYPEIVMDWHWESLRQNDSFITGARNIPAPIIFFIKYVLGHTECYPKEAQPTKFNSDLEKNIAYLNPTMWLGGFKSFYPYKIKRKAALELVKFLPHIVGSSESCLWLWSDTHKSDDVFIFFKNKDSLVASYKWEYWESSQKMVKDFLNMNVMLYASINTWCEFVLFKNPDIELSIQDALNNIDIVISKK